MTNFQNKIQLQIIRVCFTLHNCLRRIDSNDVSILLQFENIFVLEGTKRDNEDDDEHDTPVELEEVTQKDSKRDQLTQ